MRRSVVLLVAAAMTCGLAGVARAAEYEADAGPATISVDTEGRAEVDGDHTNEDPASGFVYVGTDDGVCAGDKGGHYNDTEDDGDQCNEQVAETIIGNLPLP